MMVALYIILGVLLAVIVMVITSLLWIKKQRYEDQMTELQKKHGYEKIILQDRADDWQERYEKLKLETESKQASKYRNSRGYLSHKVLADEEDEE